ncbi:MAG: hypothetical protein FWF01_01760 [Alphaproteobacteria bacterium]|nr:hypothetical protein [Alphaproteobacteria bacterium]
MSDLSSIVQYRTSFDIHSLRGQESLFHDAFGIVKNWVNRKEPATKTWPWATIGESGMPTLQRISDSFALFSLSHRAKDNDPPFMKTWGMALRERDRSHPTLRNWITEIGFKQERPFHAQVSFLTYYVNRPDYIGSRLAEPPKSVPGIVKSFLGNGVNFACQAGTQDLPLAPIRLDIDGIASFVSRMHDKERGCPLILVGCYKNDEDGLTTLVDPAELARNTCGNAVVYHMDSMDVESQLRDRLPFKYRCINDSIRVYMPRLDTERTKDHYRHRFLTRKDFEGCDSPSKEVINMLRPAISENIPQYNNLIRMADTEQRHKQAKFAEGIKAESNEAVDSFINEFISNQEEENKRLVEEKDYYLDEAAKNEEEIGKLKGKLQQVHAEKKKLEQQPDANHKQLTPKLLEMLKKSQTTANGVVNVMLEMYPDKLAFTERGMDSLEHHCQTNPELLWDCLHAMANELHDLYSSPDSKDIEAQFNSQAGGLRLALSEGKQTHKDKKLMALRNDVFKDGENEKPIFIEPHVKYGNKDGWDSVRVYYDWVKCDSGCYKLVIGHCGDHLPNYTSKTRKF